MRALSALQEQVVNAAREQLQSESWFKGVCLDNLPSDQDIIENFDDAVSDVVLETSMWDDTSLYGEFDDD